MEILSNILGNSKTFCIFTLIKILSIIRNKIVYISCLFIFFSEVYAQNKELISKTYSKLKKDNKSFEQFVFYGFCNCNDKYLYSETFEDNYTTTLNHLEPLPRFFKKEIIQEMLNEYITLTKRDLKVSKAFITMVI